MILRGLFVFRMAAWSERPNCHARVAANRYPHWHILGRSPKYAGEHANPHSCKYAQPDMMMIANRAGEPTWILDP